MTTREIIPNTPLSGAELKSLIRADFETLLANEGMLTDYIAYGRVGYRIQIGLYIDNPLSPRSNSHILSRPHPTRAIVDTPSLGAVETPPLLHPTTESTIAAIDISRNISSPNSERLRTGLPIPVLRREQDGSTIQALVKYPAPDDGDPGDVAIEDTSAELADEWRRR